MQHLFRACETNMSNLSSVSYDEQAEALWRHQIETFFRVTGPFCGEFTGDPHTRPVTRTFDVFFHLCVNKRLVNNREAGDLRCHRTHCDIIVMETMHNTGISDYTQRCLLTSHITKGQVTSFLLRFCFSITNISILPSRSRTGTS